MFSAFVCTLLFFSLVQFRAIVRVTVEMSVFKRFSGKIKIALVDDRTSATHCDRVREV